MQLKNLDDTDRQILKHLSENGRLSNADLGRLVNLTRAAVRERINRLIDNEIIDRFTIVVNPLKAGKMLSMYFTVEVDWASMESVAEKLMAADETTNVYQMSGQPHLHVHVLFDNQEHADRYVRELQGIDGITRVCSEFLIRRYKERGALLI
ncbi:asnc bacterial regulatory protein hth signature [Lucifera butyrica]|uniref:Asnc bacterial regulatory protein hth signature n=1 Tax=Lucifera butyrica TaxID=1351585 RepID=A0A498R2V0_9FIRM|nr:Lrp/AsnC family transcriptional regulator [Lucifera butyrica]VBB05147.1 asnc bacterial regulatory protein hth signature [Lucifera butyrica]